MQRTLDPLSLRALLNALGPDEAEAALKYEGLRVRLIRFFRWNRCLRPEELADEALDRLAAKLGHPTETIQDPNQYITGIARKLMLEYRAGEVREQKMLARLAWWMTAFRAPEAVDEEHEDALSRCLEALPEESRQLLDRYYTGDAGDRIRNRRSLAEEMGVELNALRNRALRIRRQLEECTSRRLAGTDGRDRSAPSLTVNGERKVR